MDIKKIREKAIKLGGEITDKIYKNKNIEPNEIYEIVELVKDMEEIARREKVEIMKLKREIEELKGDNKI